MRIKGITAGFLACMLVTAGPSPVCYAAEGAAEAAETAATETDGGGQTAGTDGSGDVAEAAGASLPAGFTLGGETALPEGVAIDGRIAFSVQELEQILEALTGADTGAGGGTAAGAEPGTVSIGTVNVSGDTWLNLRSGPGMEHPVIGHLLRGTEVEVTGGAGDWYEVVVPEATGYVHRDYLDVEERTVPAPAPAPDTGGSTGGADGKSLMVLFRLMLDGMGDAGGGAAESPSAPLTPDGNLTLADDYGRDQADGSGKQFITLVTKAGNTFYLVIDRDDKGEQNVHFLNLVDEADLLALTDGEAAPGQAVPEPEAQAPAVTPEPEATAGPEKTEAEGSVPKTGTVPVLILVLVLLAGGGYSAYTKLFKGGGKKQQAKPDPDADYLDGGWDGGLPDDGDGFGSEDDGGDGFSPGDGGGGGFGPEEDAGSGFDAEDDEPV